MMHFLQQSVWAVFIFAFLAQQSEGSPLGKAAFLNSLFSNYDKELTPNEDANGPVVVNHTLNIYRVLSLENDVLTMSVWEFMKWKDPRLQWSLDTFNSSEIRVRGDWLWRPDIVLIDSEVEYTGLNTGGVYAVVYNDGTVSLIPPRITKSTCIFSESDLFEHNEVTCSLKYMSWTRSLASLDLKISSQPDLQLNDNQYWSVVNKTAVRNAVKYSCCPEQYVDIAYSIQLKRIK